MTKTGPPETATCAKGLSLESCATSGGAISDGNYIDGVLGAGGPRSIGSGATA